MRVRALWLLPVLVPLLLLSVRAEAGADPTEPEPSGSEGPGDLVLVLDASGSMAERAGGQSRIEAARRALTRVIDGLPDEQRVALRVFGAEVEFADQPGACEDSQRVVDLGTENREDLREAIGAYRPFGETPTGHALREAGEDLGDSERGSIVLVSDGEPTCAPDPCEVARDLTEDGVDVRIDVVGLSVSGAARRSLECVAEEGGGTYYDAAGARDIVDSLTTTATRAARPFDFNGRPVQGSADPEGAPMIGQGLWLDTMPSRAEPRYYRLPRTEPGSTLHVGLLTRSRPDATLAAARLSLLPADGGTSCFSTSTTTAVLGMRTPLLTAGGSSARATDPDAPCATADELVVEVEHPTGNIEPLAGQPLELAVYEEPPLADAETVPTGVEPLEPGAREPMEPDGKVVTVVPGTSLASAPLIGDGTWAADVQPGEAQVFAVPVDWGQDVQFQLDTRITGAAAEAAAVGSELTLTPIGPLREDGAVDYYAQEPPDWTTTAFGNIPAGQPYRTGARTQPVSYANRTAAGAPAAAATAGVRYVRVSYNVRGARANLPYTLTVRTNGTAGEGAPEYDDASSLAPPVADSRLIGVAGPAAVGGAEEEAGEDEPAEASDEPSLPDPDTVGGGVPSLGMAAVAVGTAVLVLGGVLWVVLRARNRGRRA